jgi:type II secretory pathway pseudopilin PulG
VIFARIPVKPAVRLQRGFALIAVLALAALITAFLIASALNRSSADVSNERDQRTMQALRQAKAALIAYAASEQLQLYKGQDIKSPGALPCPDINNNGSSPGLCSGPASNLNRVGRLPYLTIGADDLRDATGERLWYAVSSNFWKNFGTNIVNSDTPGLLTVTGDAPATNVVAIVFAPGAPVKDSTLPGQIQNRTGTNINRAASYLENFQIGVNDYTFASAASPSDVINDRLLVITQGELMAAVEPAVAARIERDIKPQIQAYYSTFGAYPYAAPFVSGGTGPGRTQQEYKGAAGQTTGLLPLTTDPNWLTWQSPVAVSQIPGGTGNGEFGPSGGTCPPAGGGCPSGAGSFGHRCTLDSVSCNVSSGVVSCRIDYCGGSDDRPAIALQVLMGNGALSFPKLKGTEPQMKDENGDNVQSDPSGVTGDWSWSDPLFVPAVSYAAQSSGKAVVVFLGRLQNAASPPGGTGGRVFLTIAPPTTAFDPITSGDPAVNSTGAWFITNQWYRQTYFAFSSGFVPQGPNGCGGLNPPCLTVNNRPSGANTRAILILTGRALNGSPRPSNNPKDYLEGENCNLTAGNDLDIGSSPTTCNLTTNDRLYEHRAGAPTTINDRIVVLSPP